MEVLTDNEQLRGMYRCLYLYQLLNESIKLEVRLDSMREKLRHEIDPRQLFDALKKKHERYADIVSVSESTKAPLEDVELMFRDVGLDRMTMPEFYQLLGDEDTFSESSTDTQVQQLRKLRTPSMYKIEIQLHSLREYLREAVHHTEAIEHDKEDLINEFGCVSN